MLRHWVGLATRRREIAKNYIRLKPKDTPNLGAQKVDCSNVKSLSQYELNAMVQSSLALIGGPGLYQSALTINNIK